MHYRRFGKLDWRASALGFGAMRLPMWLAVVHQVLGEESPYSEHPLP